LLDLLAHPTATHARFFCYFPVPYCYFGRFPAFALISLQICILPAPIYRDLQRPRTRESRGNHRRCHQGGQRRGDAPLLGSLCARAQKCARSARVHRHPYQFHPHHDQRVDRGQLVVPEGSDVAREIDEYVRSFAAEPWKKGIDSAPAAGKEGMAPMLESLFSPVINRRRWQLSELRRLDWVSLTS
jgi:hypothetical protein